MPANNKLREFYVVDFASTVDIPSLLFNQTGERLTGVSQITVDAFIPSADQYVFLKDQVTLNQRGTYKVEANNSANVVLVKALKDTFQQEDVVSITSGAINASKSFFITSAFTVTESDFTAPPAGVTVLTIGDIIQTGNFTGTPDQIDPVDSTGGAISVAPPGTPADDERFGVKDVGAAASSNNITVDFITAGQKLDGTIQNFILNVNNQDIIFQRDGASSSWIALE